MPSVVSSLGVALRDSASIGVSAAVGESIDMASSVANGADGDLNI